MWPFTIFNLLKRYLSRAFVYRLAHLATATHSWVRQGGGFPPPSGACSAKYPSGAQVKMCGCHNNYQYAEQYTFSRDRHFDDKESHQWKDFWCCHMGVSDEIRSASRSARGIRNGWRWVKTTIGGRIPVSNSAHSQQVEAAFVEERPLEDRPHSGRSSAVGRVAKIVRDKAADRRGQSARKLAAKLSRKVISYRRVL